MAPCNKQVWMPYDDVHSVATHLLTVMHDEQTIEGVGKSAKLLQFFLIGFDVVILSFLAFRDHLGLPLTTWFSTPHLWMT